jgi:hypothetical protein
VAGTLPTGAVYNGQTYFNAIVARMTATVSGGNILWGQLGGNQPNGPLPGSDSQAGLWFGNPLGGMGYWNDYNTDAASYLPIPVVCGQFVNGALRTSNIVCGAVAANQTITTPDASGTMALFSDIIQQLGSQTFSGMSTVNVDWNVSHQPVYIIMTGNVTVRIYNNKDGMIQDFWLENPTQGSTFTISFPGVFFENGTAAPTLSPGISGFRVIDHVRIYICGGIAFGELASKNHQITVGSDHTLPAPVSASGQANEIDITMNAVLAGGSLAASDFVVLVNGTQVNVTSATYSGVTVDVSVANAMARTATVTVKYIGTDMKSVAGNVVPPFGPITVAISGGGGIHNTTLGTGGQPP